MTTASSRTAEKAPDMSGTPPLARAARPSAVGDRRGVPSLVTKAKRRWAGFSLAYETICCDDRGCDQFAPSPSQVSGQWTTQNKETHQSYRDWSFLCVRTARKRLICPNLAVGAPKPFQTGRKFQRRQNGLSKPGLRAQNRVIRTKQPLAIRRVVAGGYARWWLLRSSGWLIAT